MSRSDSFDRMTDRCWKLSSGSMAERFAFRIEKKIGPTVRGWLSASSDSKQRTDLRASTYRTVRATTLYDDRAQDCLGCSRQKSDKRLSAIGCPATGESTRLVPLAAIVATGRRVAPGYTPRPSRAC